MFKVKFTNAYKKSYKLMKKRGKDLVLLEEVVDLSASSIGAGFLIGTVRTVV